jgi:hypothetical protein
MNSFIQAARRELCIKYKEGYDVRKEDGDGKRI